MLGLPNSHLEVCHDGGQVYQMDCLFHAAMTPSGKVLGGTTQGAAQRGTA